MEGNWMVIDACFASHSKGFFSSDWCGVPIYLSSGVIDMFWFVCNVVLTVLESPEAKCERLLSFLRRKGKNVVDHRPPTVLKDCFFTLTLL